MRHALARNPGVSGDVIIWGGWMGEKSKRTPTVGSAA